MSVRMKTKSNSRRGRAARTVNGGRRGSMVAPSALCLTTWHARGPRQMDTAWRQRLRDVAPARSVSLTTDGGRRQPRIIHHKQTTGNFSFLPFYFSSLLSSPPPTRLTPSFLLTAETFLRLHARATSATMSCAVWPASDWGVLTCPAPPAPGVWSPVACGSMDTCNGAFVRLMLIHHHKKHLLLSLFLFLSHAHGYRGRRCRSRDGKVTGLLATILLTTSVVR